MADLFGEGIDSCVPSCILSLIASTVSARAKILVCYHIHNIIYAVTLGNFINNYTYIYLQCLMLEASK